MGSKRNSFLGGERAKAEQELIVCLLCVAVFVTLAVFTTGKERTRLASDGAAELLYPLERPAGLLVERFGQFHRWTEERRDLLMDLAELQEKLRQMSLQGRGRDLAETKGSSVAENRYPIVYRHPREWWESARVRTDGECFAPGSAAFDGSDLVGIVTRGVRGVAWIRLITSSQFFAPVVVAETREIGVVTGDDRGGVWLMYLPNGGASREGMHVLTALGSRLSAGLPVGIMSDETRSVFPGTVEFRVRASADVFRLQYVHLANASEEAAESEDE